MSEEHLTSSGSQAGRIDGHRLAEFIYGTITGMVALAGLSSGDDITWIGAAGIVVAGAVAIWIAHAYAVLIGKRMVSGHRMSGGDLTEALRGSWPIVLAGLLLILPLIASGLGLWGLDFALWAASLVGVVVLALIGVLAGTITKETWPRRVFLALLTAGLGLAVVAVELAVHH